MSSINHSRVKRVNYRRALADVGCGQIRSTNVKHQWKTRSEPSVESNAAGYSSRSRIETRTDQYLGHFLVICFIRVTGLWSNGQQKPVWPPAVPPRCLLSDSNLSSKLWSGTSQRESQPLFLSECACVPYGLLLIMISKRHLDVLHSFFP